MTLQLCQEPVERPPEVVELVERLNATLARLHAHYSESASRARSARQLSEIQRAYAEASDYTSSMLVNLENTWPSTRTVMLVDGPELEQFKN